MVKTANKTMPTGADVAAFVDGVADPAQRADARTLIDVMQRLSGEAPYMFGSSIVGFGTYHYRYESGREGDACRIGFSPRKGHTVIYLLDGYEHRSDQLARLGKHKIGKSCLYIKRLSEVDETVLAEMITDSLAYVDAKYPAR